jgi:hypothetical protein
MLGGAASADDSPLAQQMDLIDDAYKAIKRIDDPAAGVKEARAGQAATLKAVTMVPEMVAKMPDGAAKDKEVAAYKAQMGELFLVFCKAEQMFLAGEVGEDKIDELVDLFKAAKKAGHDKFIEEE